MKRSWLHAHLAEADVVEGRLRRILWRAGSVSTLGAVAVSTLVRDPMSVVRGGTMKVAPVVLSAVNLLAGLALVVLWLSIGREPLVVLVLAAVLMVQGGYTLVYVAGWLDRARPAARNVLLAGSAAALVVGSIGFITGAIVNMQPANPDPEYGPMTVAVLLAAHGAITLASAIADGRGNPLPS